ncbi:hypothetical protein CBR64_20910 [Cellulosimicrobium cellulans]|uniref:Uncharacterized protein n=1 Tax=Cellulosimicrobium cellulans TaxID=1710 RepID=A0A1Y0HZT1_CELCE|nr:hypothetical protein [Cellulosimicrobium cellulans]ARU53520.1 hypothetical protein CBR64_20910 [Cellulosimicrobium cellulans]
MEGDWKPRGRRSRRPARGWRRDDLIDAARRIGREGPSEIEKMQRALRDTGDAGRTLGDELDDTARQISDSFEENAITPDDLIKAEVIGEVVQNFNEAGAEVARGFKDGFSSEDAETILDGVTDTVVAVGAVAVRSGARLDSRARPPFRRSPARSSRARRKRQPSTRRRSRTPSTRSSRTAPRLAATSRSA